MSKVNNTSQESKSIYNAIAYTTNQGLNLSKELLKAQVKVKYLQWRLESLDHKDLTVIEYDSSTGVLLVEDDRFGDIHTLDHNDLYNVFNEPYLISLIGEFDDEDFGTCIHNMYIDNPYELGIVCSYAIYHNYIEEIFEQQYEKILRRFEIDNELRDSTKATIPA